ncbi:MAG: dephospho-CoA kinase [Candidatus Cloacimonetes bacterium]|nr:dephospho-CoA kinase [Candidatus Cloacimonadota bacterium]
MKPYKRPFLIAITGGIASGKTTVSKWFENKDFKVYYADKIGHTFLNDKDIILKLVERFGNKILSDNKIDRKKLGNIVFKSKEDLYFLNQLLHPKIRKETQEIIDSSTEDYLIFEIPLLFENRIEKAFDLTINISANKENQIGRLKNNYGITLKEIEQRIKAQMSDFDKQKLADININNNSTINDLYNKLENLLPIIRKLKHKEVLRLTHI